MSDNWRDRASCADFPSQGIDPWFDSEGEEERYARRICDSCPVQVDCLRYALEHTIPCGIWGGMGPSERREIARRSRGIYRVPSTAYNDISQYIPITRRRDAG